MRCLVARTYVWYSRHMRGQSSGAAPLLPDRLRRRREERHLSVKEIYSQARVSRAYYYDLEHKVGIRPAADIVERLARVLDTTTAYLLGQTEVIGRTTIGSVPRELRDLAARRGLAREEVEMLSRITWQGKRPRTAADWEFLIEAISRAVT